MNRLSIIFVLFSLPLHSPSGVSVNDGRMSLSGLLPAFMRTPSLLPGVGRSIRGANAVGNAPGNFSNGDSGHDSEVLHGPYVDINSRFIAQARNMVLFVDQFVYFCFYFITARFGTANSST